MKDKPNIYIVMDNEEKLVMGVFLTIDEALRYIKYLMIGKTQHRYELERRQLGVGV